MFIWNIIWEKYCISISIGGVSWKITWYDIVKQISGIALH